VTSTAAAYDLIQVRSSRLWALVHFNFTRWLFPARMVADHVGVSTSVIRFWLTPWQGTDEHLPMSHIAEVTHSRGLIWDQISVESSGGLNPLVIPGLRRGKLVTSWSACVSASTKPALSRLRNPLASKNSLGHRAGLSYKLAAKFAVSAAVTHTLLRKRVCGQPANGIFVDG
jgi:hypothetical protein